MQKVVVELTNFVSACLEASYLGIFQHLQNVVQNEGFHNGEVVVERSPFTSFSITRDYNCRPHLDQDDYDLRFIIWLQEGIYFVSRRVSILRIYYSETY